MHPQRPGIARPRLRQAFGSREVVQEVIAVLFGDGHH
jgi:hypothetical protein